MNLNIPIVETAAPSVVPSVVGTPGSASVAPVMRNNYISMIYSSQRILTFRARKDFYRSYLPIVDCSTGFALVIVVGGNVSVVCRI